METQKGHLPDPAESLLGLFLVAELFFKVCYKTTDNKAEYDEFPFIYLEEILFAVNQSQY